MKLPLSRLCCLRQIGLPLASASAALLRPHTRVGSKIWPSAAGQQVLPNAARRRAARGRSSRRDLGARADQSARRARAAQVEALAALAMPIINPSARSSGKGATCTCASSSRVPGAPNREPQLYPKPIDIRCFFDDRSAAGTCPKTGRKFEASSPTSDERVNDFSPLLVRRYRRTQTRRAPRLALD